MDPIKYSEEELLELAKGVFKDDKTSPSIYADEIGNFRNSVQYGAMSDEDKAKFPFEFKNPNVKQVKVSAEETQVILIDGESIPASELKEYFEALQSKLKLRDQNLADANAEIERLNGLKSVAAVNAVQKDLDAANATIKTLQDSLAALTKKPEETPQA